LRRANGRYLMVTAVFYCPVVGSWRQAAVYHACMGRQRDSSGRFTSGGGGGTQLGSAYGKVVIDASGVRSGVSTANSALGKLGSGLGNVAKAGTMALAAAGAAAMAVTTAFVAVAASGVKMSMALEAQMSGVKAVMQIADQQVQQLRDHVLELGVDPNLKVSAMQAAAAIEMLGRNGLNAKEILDGAARSTILLSNATSADFSQAADIATDVMALFNFQASEMEIAVDGITSVVNNSKFSITDYQYALAQAGGIASTAGVSFDDLNTTIAAISPLFADGSSAGAGFKVMLQRMANPTGEMAQVMKELNLMTADGANLFFTEAGEMKSMSEVARLLTENMGHLTDEQKNQALSIMFGTRSVNAAAGLMRYGATVTLTAAEAMEIFGVSMDEATAMVERGITEFDLLQAAMGNTSAAAAAAARMDNLAGSLEILQGVVETLRIRIGDVFNKDIRNAVNGLTQFLSANADRIVAIFASVRTFAAGILNVIKAFLGGLTRAMSGTLGDVERNANGWGRNIVIQLARGMAAAATAVIRVVNSIGIAITKLLKPGSPPKLLPEIDDWGTGTIDAWLSGFTAADFSVFDDLADTVERHLRNIAPADDTTLIERILGSREVLADIIRQIRETGQIGADAFRAAAWRRPAHCPTICATTSRRMLDLEVATARVDQAQQRLDAIRQLSSDLVARLMCSDGGCVWGAVGGTASPLRRAP
jgi:TP901 family phage tail tape measure protein